MANSPQLNSTAVVKCSVFSEGNALKESFNLISIVTEKCINKISSAVLTFEDGDLPNQKFPMSDSDEFAPGRKITIKAGYGDAEEQIYEGIVVRHGISIAINASTLVVECRDSAIAMTIGRKNANYVDKKNSEIITLILGQYSDLTKDIDDSTTQFPELVQFNVTDWDYIVARAESSGLLVLVDDNKVSVKKPSGTSEPLLTVTYGIDLMEFEADVDARNVYKQVKSVGWDLDTLKVVEQAVTPVTINKQGNLTADTLAQVMSLDIFKLQTTVPLVASALKEWATAKQQKSYLSTICGKMLFQGNASVKLAGLIEVKGVGDRFNGNVFISGIRHEIINGNWTTEIMFGMDSSWFTETTNVNAESAAGLTAGVDGLMVGIVKQLDEDPEGQNRVQVTIPVLQAETEGVWARLIQYYASSGFGNFFIPEIGDEVVIGYFNNDPSNPVILGSLYSSNHTPPYDLTSDNFIKALVTKSGHKIEFDDDKKVITILTPGGNTLIFSDEDKSIKVSDVNDNSIALETGGITLNSQKDITIKATGKITLDAVDKISITSKADVATAGLNISNKANVGFTAQGNATAELSASGQTTVKGAMVMIN